VFDRRAAPFFLVGGEAVATVLSGARNVFAKMEDVMTK
jgi:hypothetical protein